MKATGIVRKIDELGRVVIPKEIRDTHGISEKDALEIYVDGESIILTKYQRGCIFCGDLERNFTDIGGKQVCGACAEKIADRFTLQPF